MTRYGVGLGLVLGVGALLAMGRWAVPPADDAAGPEPAHAPRDQAAPREDDRADPGLDAFEAAVLRELGRPAPADARGGDGPTPQAARRAPRAGADPDAPAVVPARAGGRSAAIESMIASGEIGAVDWEYVEDVFEGRVEGIPSERRAGIPLPVLDALGEIPYVEALRREGRMDELARLGLGPVRSSPGVMNLRLQELVEERRR